MSEMKLPEISRDTYRKLKRMDRDEITAALIRMYIKGYEEGRKAAAPDALINAFRDLLISVDSIGPARADAIMRKFAEKFAGGAGVPAESERKDEEKQGTEAENDEEGSSTN